MFKRLFNLFGANPFIVYFFMISFGIAAGLSEIHFLHELAQTISDIFIKLFKCISIPLIALSIMVTLLSDVSSKMYKVLHRTAFYTLATTLIAAIISCILYLFIRPGNINSTDTISNTPTHGVNYGHYLTTLIPANFLSPFLENQVISVLIIGIVVGVAIRFIPDPTTKQTIIHFFKAMHTIFFVITKWIVAILPIGLFGFIATTTTQIHQGVNIKGLGEYLAVIVAANLIQGLCVLPIWLKLNGIAPFKTMRGMMPALSLAFFSKSSAGTLPVTIATMEKNLQVSPKISRLVLPLCTSINMNGCAAFIFTTVIFLMQNHGIPITPMNMGLWIIIASIAAIGNAGVPMGCFFLSASLLASMDVPIILMGVILPFYSAIDMLETTLNVWSDSCVATVIDRQMLQDDKEINPGVHAILE
jgi:Na+/H+-dicarboxylate symporter